MADNVDLQVKNVVYTDVGQSGEKMGNQSRYGPIYQKGKPGAV